MSSTKLDPQLDKVTEKELNLTLREEIAISYAHAISNTDKHIQAGERDYWNKKWDDTNATIVSRVINGIMTKEDKIKLDGIEETANNYIHPTTTINPTDGPFIRFNIDKYGHIIFAENPSSLDVKASDSKKLGGIDASKYALLDSPTFVGIPTLTTSLDANDSSNKLATTKYVNDNFLRSAYTVSAVAPGNKNKIWVDSSTGTLKYYDQASSSWVGTTAVYSEKN